MWILDKPDISKAIGIDVDTLVNHCTHLDQSDALKLKYLHKLYNKGHGAVSSAQLFPLSAKAGIIRAQFDKMSSGKTLSYIRKELNRGINSCPMCGINEPNQLDHFMDKSTYGQLACCRLNLIPVCGVCNNKKSDLPYTDFVHAYYDRNFGNGHFLITKVHIRNNTIGFTFSIDKNAIPDQDLAERTEKQFTTLSLNKRYHKRGIDFINDTIYGMNCSSDKSLKAYLSMEIQKCTQQYARNHWKTSILKGLYECAQFDFNFVNKYKSKISIKMENGIGV